MSLEELLIQIQYFFGRKKEGFFWGNQRWYSFRDILVPGRTIKKETSHWTDFSQISSGSTSEMLDVNLDPVYAFQPQRKAFNDQVLDLYLKEKTYQKRAEPIVFLTSGGTASGKTSAIDVLMGGILNANKGNYLRIDYDNIKKNIPEYEPMLNLKLKYAASYVQSESAKIGGRLFKKGFKSKIDLIYEKTLDDEIRTLQDIKQLRSKGYKIYIVATHIPVEEGLKRAEKRFNEMGRYIPEHIIRERYANVPKALFAIRKKVDGIFLYDNRGSKLKLIFQKSASGSSMDRLGYNQYLIDVGTHYDLSQ